MEYALLALAVALGAFKNILTKAVKKNSASFYDMMKRNVVAFAFALVTAFLIGIGLVKTTFQVPWILVISYAVCTLGSQIALMKAVELGSVSISSLFYSCGFILPTLFGSFYYQEELNALHFIGIVLIVFSFACSVKKEEGKKFNFAWLIAALGGGLFSGTVGIMQKLFANEYVGYRLDNFLCVAFMLIVLMSAGAMLVSWLWGRRKNNETQAEEKAVCKIKTTLLIKQYGFTVALGVVMGLVNKTNTYLSGVLPSVLVFPIANGGVILATTLLSTLIFKEKLYLLQKIGLIIGIFGIISITIGKAII